MKKIFGYLLVLYVLIFFLTINKSDYGSEKINIFISISIGIFAFLVSGFHQEVKRVKYKKHFLLRKSILLIKPLAISMLLSWFYIILVAMIFEKKLLPYIVCCFAITGVILPVFFLRSKNLFEYSNEEFNSLHPQKRAKIYKRERVKRRKFISLFLKQNPGINWFFLVDDNNRIGYKGSKNTDPPCTNQTKEVLGHPVLFCTRK